MGGTEVDYPLQGFTAGTAVLTVPKLKLLRDNRVAVLNQVLVKCAHGNHNHNQTYSGYHWLIYINIYYIIFVVEYILYYFCGRRKRAVHASPEAAMDMKS